jgi:hypothetical protein
MARKLIPIYLTHYDAFTEENDNTDFVAVGSDKRAYFEASGRDEQFVVGVYNNASTDQTVTIKAGNGLQSEFGDLTFLITTKKIAWVVLSSGRFKNVTGENKGNIVIEGASTDIQLKVIRLPF